MFKSISVYRSIRCGLKPIRPKYLCPKFTRYSSSDKKSSDESNNDQISGDHKISPLNSPEESGAQEKTLTFAKAFEKFEKLVEESKSEKKVPDNVDTETFPTLLRYSTFIQLGDPEGKTVVGKIEDIVNDDIYVDFGGKFNAICKRPRLNQNDYVRGAKVRLRVNDLELSDRFLGSPKDMTLLEADATLLGIIWSPNRSTDRNPEPEVDKL